MLSREASIPDESEEWKGLKEFHSIYDRNHNLLMKESCGFCRLRKSLWFSSLYLWQSIVYLLLPTLKKGRISRTSENIPESFHLLSDSTLENISSSLTPNLFQLFSRTNRKTNKGVNKISVGYSRHWGKRLISRSTPISVSQTALMQPLLSVKPSVGESLSRRRKEPGTEVLSERIPTSSKEGEEFHLE